MGVSDDLTTAAGHVAGLRRAVTALSKELGNTIDVQRLRDDVVRLADDVDLVARARRGRVAGPRRRTGRDRLHHRRGVRPLAVVRRRGRGRRPLAGPLRWPTRPLQRRRPRPRPGPHRRAHPARGPLVAPALRHVRLLQRLAALRPGPGQPAEGLLRRRLRLPHAVLLALPVDRRACRGRRHFGTPFGEWPAAHPVRRADAAVPAALPADLLLLPQGLLPLVLDVAAGLRGGRGRTASTPARPGSR